MRKLRTLIRTLNNNPSDIPKLIVFNLSKASLLNWLSDSAYLKLYFRVVFKKKLDLKNPKTFNEKLQWLKLYDRRPEYTNFVDKYTVREHIKKVMGEEYLVPLLGVYNSFREIDFTRLPDQFVLKCTHDSGSVIICKGKTILDMKVVMKKTTRCLSRNLFYYAREWPYKNVKPRIICEKYLDDISGAEIIDYKLMCFNGKVKCIFVCQNRNLRNGPNIDIYNSDWELMPFERPNHPRSAQVIPKPANFSKMVQFAEILSKEIPFLRVDFYEANGHLYFGELTLYPGAGFEEFSPESYDYLLGSWIELPRKAVF